MNETGNSFMVQPLDTRVCSNSTRVFVGNACRSKEVVHLNLTRFHGVFAPNSKYRALVTPAKPAYMPSLAITWAKRLKRVFDIDIETCSECGGSTKMRFHNVVGVLFFGWQILIGFDNIESLAS